MKIADLIKKMFVGEIESGCGEIYKGELHLVCDGFSVLIGPGNIVGGVTLMRKGKKMMDVSIDHAAVVGDTLDFKGIKILVPIKVD